MSHIEFQEMDEILPEPTADMYDYILFALVLFSFVQLIRSLRS